MPKTPRKTKTKKDRSAEQETPAVYFRSIEEENHLVYQPILYTGASHIKTWKTNICHSLIDNDIDSRKYADRYR